MHALSPETLLDVWAAGRDQAGLERALTLLALVSPGLSREELAELSIGERDARLFRFRAEVLGERATGFAACPACGAGVELPLDTSQFANADDRTAAAACLPDAGARVRIRAPNTHDLAAVAASDGEDEGLRCLLERCVQPVDGSVFDAAGAVRPDNLEALSLALLEADPRAEINLELDCQECGERWPLLFDVADFFWNELAAQAHRLLQEVDLIARTYGWSEREILNLPAWRRRGYVELITG